MRAIILQEPHSPRSTDTAGQNEHPPLPPKATKINAKPKSKTSPKSTPTVNSHSNGHINSKLPLTNSHHHKHALHPIISGSTPKSPTSISAGASANGVNGSAPSWTFSDILGLARSTAELDNNNTIPSSPTNHTNATSPHSTHPVLNLNIRTNISEAENCGSYSNMSTFRDSVDEIFSKTDSEDWNTKSSASTYASPRTPKQIASRERQDGRNPRGNSGSGSGGHGGGDRVNHGTPSVSVAFAGTPSERNLESKDKPTENEQEEEEEEEKKDPKLSERETEKCVYSPKRADNIEEVHEPSEEVDAETGVKGFRVTVSGNVINEEPDEEDDKEEEEESEEEEDIKTTTTTTTTTTMRDRNITPNQPTPPNSNPTKSERRFSEKIIEKLTSNHYGEKRNEKKVNPDKSATATATATATASDKHSSPSNNHIVSAEKSVPLSEKHEKRISEKLMDKFSVEKTEKRSPPAADKFTDKNTQDKGEKRASEKFTDKSILEKAEKRASEKFTDKNILEKVEKRASEKFTDKNILEKAEKRASEKFNDKNAIVASSYVAVYSSAEKTEKRSSEKFLDRNLVEKTEKRTSEKFLDRNLVEKTEKRSSEKFTDKINDKTNHEKRNSEKAVEKHIEKRSEKRNSEKQQTDRIEKRQSEKHSERHVDHLRKEQQQQQQQDGDLNKDGGVSGAVLGSGSGQGDRKKRECNGDDKENDGLQKKKTNEEFRKKTLEEENEQLKETILLLEAKIISITSVNAAMEDQLDQILEENRKLRQDWMDAQKFFAKMNKKDKKKKKMN